MCTRRNSIKLNVMPEGSKSDEWCREQPTQIPKNPARTPCSMTGRARRYEAPPGGFDLPPHLLKIKNIIQNTIQYKKQFLGYKEGKDTSL
ncbi:hypothetical protein CEXT_444271 [Caerostris extrusa]|uniref:Uncharacterized protein n=1 Tax=Caerostris extrusa TaxID=172846 RepID=A0AAV4U119_CAEEX|nr:hypothetical protein CEXT_444271 [Caerostris extrusa]